MFVRALQLGTKASVGVLLVLLVLMIGNPSTSRADGSPNENIAVGVYDPHGAFSNAPEVGIEHVYLPWKGFDRDSLTNAARYAAKRRRKLLMTIEPWTWSRKLSAQKLKARMARGAYDRTIDVLCEQISTFNVTTWIRWGHEMDLPRDRYAWMNWQPKDFIAAYRKFVSRCRRMAPKAKFVWSPRGEPNLQDYYPGDDFVDIIGLTILGLQQYDKTVFRKSRTIVQRVAPSYELVSFFNKPVIIAEFGCLGDAAYIQRCGDFSPKTLASFPLLTAVIFFSEVETGGWPDIPFRPDWRIKPNSPLYGAVARSLRLRN